MTTPRAWQPCPAICAPRRAAAADTAVRKALTDCMAQKELAPVGCPFARTTRGATALNVVWSSTSRAAGHRQPGPHPGSYASRHRRAGREVRGVGPTIGAPQDETVTADLSGTVNFDGKTATVTFDQGNGGPGD